MKWSFFCLSFRPVVIPVDDGLGLSKGISSSRRQLLASAAGQQFRFTGFTDVRVDKHSTEHNEAPACMGRTALLLLTAWPSVVARFAVRVRASNLSSPPPGRCWQWVTSYCLQNLCLRFPKPCRMKDCCSLLPVGYTVKMQIEPIGDLNRLCTMYGEGGCKQHGKNNCKLHPGYLSTNYIDTYLFSRQPPQLLQRKPAAQF